jgi:hypothetical protein
MIRYHGPPYLTWRNAMPRGKNRNQNPFEVVDSEYEKTLLRQIEDEWLGARLRGEIEATQRLLDDSYEGTTSSGVVQTKTEFIKSLQLSRMLFTDAEHTVRNIRVHGNLAISTGTATLRSADRENTFRYIRVFLKNGGEWHLIASQATGLQAG